MSRKPAKKPAKTAAKKTNKKPARIAAKAPARKIVKKAKPARAAAAPRRLGGSDLSWNFKLIAHDTLAGFGGMGEGMAGQVAKEARRILCVAHEKDAEHETA